MYSNRTVAVHAQQTTNLARHMAVINCQGAPRLAFLPTDGANTVLLSQLRIVFGLGEVVQPTEPTLVPSFLLLLFVIPPPLTVAMSFLPLRTLIVFAVPFLDVLTVPPPPLPMLFGFAGVADLPQIAAVAFRKLFDRLCLLALAACPLGLGIAGQPLSFLG
jgi:hypothetical protein